MKSQVIERQDASPVAVVDEPKTILQVIQRAAADPQCDIEKMERLMAMHERMQARDAETKFNLAMSAAQSEMRPVGADADNKQTRSKYATYAKLDGALRPIYTRHGFSLSFNSEPAEADVIRVICYVSHSDGHTRSYMLDMPADGKGAKGGDVMTKTHAVGSGASYGMRYLLKMIFNVAVGEDDDDGNSASGADLRDAAMSDLLRRVDEAEDQEELTKIWKSGVTVLRAARDAKGYEELKAAVAAKGNQLEAANAAH
ncbi:ERF family protein [Pseudomonas sp. SP16.1]|uniref:ERF family protein n=1 Tax=Pseudomonas sp. SP16.1 TaxID=3458854 RepID=UPI004045FCCC